MTGSSEHSEPARPAASAPAEGEAAVGGEPGAWLTPGRFALLLAALVFAAFPQVLLGLQSFVVRDFGFFAYPLAYYQRECFWRGELPLWDPYNNCGVPFLAQWNTMPLYPPALIYLLLPLGWSLSFFSLLHLFFAGLGMYCLAYRWTGNRLAAALAGVVFAFNGLTLNLLMWPSHIATFSWMPWVVLSVQQAWREGGRKLVVAALAGALQMLAGGPETILFTWLILVGLWVLEARRGVKDANWPGRKSEIRNPKSETDSERKNCGNGEDEGLWVSGYRFALVVLLVAGLAAVQLLPFLDLAAHSQRESGYADARWSLPGWGWANFLVPMVFGHVWSMGVFFQYEQSWTSSYYLGIGTLLLLLLAVGMVRNRRVGMMAVAAGVALLLAFGDQVAVGRWLRHLIPQLSLMTYPVKFVIVIAFVAPLLAAFGLKSLAGRSASHERPGIAHVIIPGGLLLILLALILCWAWKYPFATDDFPATLRNGLSRAGLLAAAAALLLALEASWRKWGLRSGRREMLLSLLLLFVFWLDLWTHEPNQNPSASPTVYDPGLARTKLAQNPQPTLGESRAMVTPSAEVRFTQFIMRDPAQNYLVKRLGYFSDCNLLDDVPKVDGFFSLYPREGGELTSVLYGSTNASFPRLEDFLSVSQITAPGKVFDWEPRATFLPLATAGQQPVFLDDTNSLRSLIRPDFAPRARVFLPPGSKGLVSITHQTRARVLKQQFKQQRVDLDVEAAEPSLVVLSQTFYHPWRAYVDGHPTALLRANYAFQAVEVPGGAHHVLLAYEDRALYFGAGVTLAAVLACSGLWWAGKPRA